jgi:hypothetical protein
MAENAPQRRADITGRERAGCYLVEQRLEEVEVAAVDQYDIQRRTTERARRVKPAESPSENDYPVSDNFRIANCLAGGT